MHPQSNQPGPRARFLSALKLSNKPNRPQGISSSNFKRAKANEMVRSKLIVKPTSDQCDDPLLVALARSANTSTSNRYARQRSTKVPVRVPAGFPVNQNFSQKVIYAFEDVKGEPELEESSADEDDSLDQCDPLLAALARSANNSTSRRYAGQRSAKVPIRVPAGFPVNQNFSQKVIYTFENVKDVRDKSRADGKVILLAKHEKSKGIEFPRLEMPEVKNASELVNWTLSTPARGSKMNKPSPSSKVSSTLVTPRLTISSASSTSSVVATVDSSVGTQSATPSPLTRPRLTPRWARKKQTTPSSEDKLYTIHEALLSPFGLPSPAPVILQGGKSYEEILAGLEFLNKFYGEM